MTDIYINNFEDDTLSKMSQISLIEDTIVKYYNIFQNSFINRLTKFQNSVGHSVLELLKTIKKVLVGNVFCTQYRKVTNMIDAFQMKNYQLTKFTNNENDVNTQLIV